MCVSVFTLCYIPPCIMRNCEFLNIKGAVLKVLMRSYIRCVRMRCGLRVRAHACFVCARAYDSCAADLKWEGRSKNAATRFWPA